MSKCRHCGNDAGWFRAFHAECESKYSAVKSAALQDASRGLVPRRFNVAGQLGMRLASGETVVWAFPGARYSELQRQRRGGHSYGLSARVAKGLWYSERFYQKPEYDYLPQQLGVGLLVVTNRGVRFKSANGTIVLDSTYTDIDDVVAFSDGVGLHIRSRSTKPQQTTYVCEDGNFAAQLIWHLWQHRQI